MPTNLDEKYDWPPIIEISSENWENSKSLFQTESELLMNKLSQIEGLI